MVIMTFLEKKESAQVFKHNNVFWQHTYSDLI